MNFCFFLEYAGRHGLFITRSVPQEGAHAFLPDMLVRGDQYMLSFNKSPLSVLDANQTAGLAIWRRDSSTAIGYLNWVAIWSQDSIGHVSRRSQPAWEMDRCCHERSTCERAPRWFSTLTSRSRAACAVEKHETQNHSQIWCFGTQHWATRDRQLKSSARRTRCCKMRDLAQTRVRQLLLNQDCGRLDATSVGLESSSRLPWCDRGLMRPSLPA